MRGVGDRVWGFSGGWGLAFLNVWGFGVWGVWVRYKSGFEIVSESVPTIVRI